MLKNLKTPRSLPIIFLKKNSTMRLNDHNGTRLILKLKHQIPPRNIYTLKKN